MSSSIDILKVTRNSFPLEHDETDFIYWLSVLPEAKRHVKRKIRNVRQKINELELQLAVHDARISIDVRDAQLGTATERKKIAEDKYYISNGYVSRQRKINEYYALIDDYQADWENLNDKSFSIRKLLDLYKVNSMYEDE